MLLWRLCDRPQHPSGRQIGMNAMPNKGVPPFISPAKAQAVPRIVVRYWGWSWRTIPNRGSSFANLWSIALNSKQQIFCRWKFINTQVPIGKLFQLPYPYLKGCTSYVSFKLHSAATSLFPRHSATRLWAVEMEGTSRRVRTS